MLSVVSCLRMFVGGCSLCVLRCVLLFDGCCVGVPCWLVGWLLLVVCNLVCVIWHCLLIDVCYCLLSVAVAVRPLLFAVCCLFVVCCLLLFVVR